ncbi:carotenoid 9,10(9',10')-cleavage dioxygenase 1-like [Dorcoceras hygrometricum]|uniref:Carotenoid 9,10(9',10')-cleavage dioxygenase 1-like n=1 Tax=Dorcoceras hygrometricum TaxID=472368 RepID=A0A2Z6ZQL1_9LAMI|nr:carotenoid 9,10(9',10')-cleavage dioxygenase 1-like [Dorcoceras hygrometricum]
MMKYVSSILRLLKTPLHFVGHRCHHIASSFNLIVTPLVKRNQLLRADIGRGFLRRRLLYRIEKLLRSQYKIKVAEPVLIVKTSEPVAIQYSSKRVFHRNHFYSSYIEKKTDMHY